MPPHATAHLLGRAQDAGVPQAGCACPRCAAAWADPARAARPACLGIVDDMSGERWLIDATPAFPSQLHDLLAVEAGEAGGEAALAGIVLTHAHIGHYTGLLHLGREAMGVRGVPVYASARMADFLRSNAPWRQLVELGNVVLRVLEPGVRVALGGRIAVTAVPVPHRAEWSDTLAIVVAGPSRRLLWCPDIDRWDGIDGGLTRLVLDHQVDVACLDGTFLDAAELGGRDMREVPHPLAGDTAAAVAAARAAGWAGEAWLVHLNHTNGLLEDDAAAAEWAAAHGVDVGREGQRWRL
ncbi:MAG: MBL fold metallo-hydrolase [Ardenticatenales bacterium]